MVCTFLRFFTLQKYTFLRFFTSPFYTFLRFLPYSATSFRVTTLPPSIWMV